MQRPSSFIIKDIQSIKSESTHKAALKVYDGLWLLETDANLAPLHTFRQLNL